MSDHQDTASTSEFDRETAVVPVGESLWRAEISAGWNIGNTPNGGYLLAIGTRALSLALPHPDPLTVTGHFLARSKKGPMEVEVKVHRLGSSTSTASATMSQGGEPKVVLLATFCDLSRANGVTRHEEGPPVLPLPEECVAFSGMPAEAVALQARMQQLFAPQSAGWARGELSPISDMRGWVGFADGRAPDLLSLAFFSDCFPPAAFASMGAVGWVPTLELTVHFRAKPSAGLLRCAFRSRSITGGFTEEDGELWDAEGKLVALSRQMAKVLRRG